MVSTLVPKTLTKVLSPSFSLVFSVSALVSLSACMSAPPTGTIFKTPGIDSARWDRIQHECSYEAEKATAAADPRTAVAYAWRRVFVMCFELKGATYVGQVSMPDEQWQQISSVCENEAEAAVAKQLASRKRDELKENLEVECLKRSGAVFRQD
jgi:hypothetical protein